MPFSARRSVELVTIGDIEKKKTQDTMKTPDIAICIVPFLSTRDAMRLFSTDKAFDAISKLPGARNLAVLDRKIVLQKRAVKHAEKSIQVCEQHALTAGPSDDTLDDEVNAAVAGAHRVANSTLASALKKLEEAKAARSDVLKPTQPISSDSVAVVVQEENKRTEIPESNVQPGSSRDAKTTTIVGSFIALVGAIGLLYVGLNDQKADEDGAYGIASIMIFIGLCIFRRGFCALRTIQNAERGVRGAHETLRQSNNINFYQPLPENDASVDNKSDSKRSLSVRV